MQASFTCFINATSKSWPYHRKKTLSYYSNLVRLFIMRYGSGGMVMPAPWCALSSRPSFRASKATNFVTAS